jgi:putative glutamine amidotransferase
MSADILTLTIYQSTLDSGVAALSHVSGGLRPAVGITTRLDVTRNTFYLRRYYAEAIAASGGTPVHIPLIPDRAYLRDLAGRLDAVVLSGSDSDVDPMRYGETPHPALGSLVPERDLTDFLMLEFAEELKLPVLGICFGIQSLNVSRGGSLIQDIDAQVNGALRHEKGDLPDLASHSVRLEPESLLARLSGSENAIVNSSHHQAVGRVGSNLEVIARSEDGVVEALVDPRPDRFVLAVQWHPEMGWEKDALSKAIFQRLIEEARVQHV